MVPKAISGQTGSRNMAEIAKMNSQLSTSYSIPNVPYTLWGLSRHYQPLYSQNFTMEPIINGLELSRFCASCTAKIGKVRQLWHPSAVVVHNGGRSQDANSKTMLAHAIHKVNWSPLYAMQGCDEMATCFYDTITGIIDHYLPCVAMKQHTNDKPWVTDEFRRLTRCRQNALVSGEKTKYRMLRNSVQRMSRQLRRKYYDQKVCGLRENNSHSWWRSVNQITGMESKSTVPLRGLADELYDGNMEVLTNGINEFFQQVAADLHPLLDSFMLPPADHFLSEFFIDSTTVELKLSRVKISKAPVPDGVPNWILRDFCTELSGPVCAMFHASIREGIVPQRWKEAKVLPVPKTHPPRLIETDLQPMSLTSTLVKLLERLLVPGCPRGLRTSWMCTSTVHSKDGQQLTL